MSRESMGAVAPPAGRASLGALPNGAAGGSARKENARKAVTDAVAAQPSEKPPMPPAKKPKASAAEKQGFAAMFRQAPTGKGASKKPPAKAAAQAKARAAADGGADGDAAAGDAPLVEPCDIFADLAARTKADLTRVAHACAGRPLRVATMCSGTESPLLALDMLTSAFARLADAGTPPLAVEHVFSCEIEPFKQGYLSLIHI